MTLTSGSASSAVSAGVSATPTAAPSAGPDASGESGRGVLGDGDMDVEPLVVDGAARDGTDDDAGVRRAIWM